MARAGRKRKLDAERYPNGMVKPEEAPSPCATKRLIMASLAGMADPQWGTVIGRYFLSGYLDPNQYEAAKRYGAICEAYAIMLQGPRPPKTSTGEMGTLSSQVDPDTELGQAEADYHKRTKERYDQVKTILMAYGTVVENEMTKMSVGVGAIPSYESLIKIKKILDELVLLWRIDVK